jgi:alginate O-acetyltransferase complex protein AlgI
MAFTSLTFIGFLALVLLVYWSLPTRRFQNAFLLGASLAFYAYGEPVFVLLILLCAATGYTCAIAMERRPDRARAILGLGAGIALSILFAFKYFDFFVGSIAELCAGIGLPFHAATLGLLLPIGISFFTFQTVGYLVDVYRGDCQAERSPVDFFLFVTFFPQLVAGPIERATHLLAQIKQERRPSSSDFSWGIYTALQGFVKKMVVADNIAPVVDRLFEQESLSGPLVAVALVGFAFQIYCDFSGYTDIARGVARCMGFRILINFDRPYLARSPSEFWRRWHITLSTWFRDYVYIPLGGNRCSETRLRVNLFATLVLSGLWHGASLNFLLWGAFHGGLLVLHKAWTASSLCAGLRGERIYPALARGATFALVVYGWLFFRVEDVGLIGSFSRALLFDFRHVDLALLLALRMAPYIAIACALDWLERTLTDFRHAELRWPWAAQPAVSGMLVALLVLAVEGGSDFIYFKF